MARYQVTLRDAAFHVKRMPAAFGADLMRSAGNRISFAEWSRCGLDALLIDVESTELFDMLCTSADVIAGLLNRRLLSTARTKLVAFRSLAEAMMAQASGAEALRSSGRRAAAGADVRHASAWHSTRSPTRSRAPYVLPGITDVLFPASWSRTPAPALHSLLPLSAAA